MEILNKRWKIILYGCSGLGVNMLNLIVGTYLCSALLTGGFDADIEKWTYLNKDLVVAALWGTLILVTKIIDGIIDLPLSSFSDNIKSRWGRRRPAILVGFVPMIIAYLLFLVPLNGTASVLNTVWFAGLLAIFYCAYTQTMVNFYATFSEVLDNDRDRVLLSNVKSICDVVYFIFGYALVPLFVSLGANIRIVALIFLPLALTMMIPMFLVKERSTKDSLPDNMPKPVRLGRSLRASMQNKSYMYWLCIHAVMHIGLQLFLSGINEFFSSTNLNMTFVMAASFAPIPFTLLLYNYFVKKKGLRFGIQYVLLIYSLGMILMFFCLKLPRDYLLWAAIGCSIIVSFGIGAFFSIAYVVPSQLAAETNQRTGVCVSTMFFAVQGLFEGVASGIASGVLLVWLKQSGHISIMTLVVAFFCMAAFAMTFFLPQSIAYIGKEKKEVAG